MGIGRPCELDAAGIRDNQNLKVSLAAIFATELYEIAQVHAATGVPKTIAFKPIIGPWCNEGQKAVLEANVDADQSGIMRRNGIEPIEGGEEVSARNRNLSHSTVAFEARFRDGATNEVVALFADRESEKFSILNAKDLTWYGHAKSIIREWAYQFVQLANQRKGQIIKDTAPFDLKPW